MAKNIYEPKRVFRKVKWPDLPGSTKPKPARGRVLSLEEPRLTRPRLKGGAELVAQEEVFRGLVNVIEVWKSPKGFYVYYVYPDGHLVLATGPHKRESTALRHAQELKQALEAI